MLSNATREEAAISGLRIGKEVKVLFTNNIMTCLENPKELIEYYKSEI